jgi:hypothetical protein
MSTTRFLSKENLWPTLKNLARKCRQRKMVAVPYLGRDGSKPLGLRKDDVLICALTEANAKKGLVCPDEIENLQRKGVRVYIEDCLHAKVYLLGRTAVVCSANLSQRSVNSLDEAGALITDWKVTPSIREWFEERMSAPVTPEWLKHCKKVYKPPKGEGKDLGSRKRRENGSIVWLIGVQDTTFPADEEDEEEVRKSGHREALKGLRRGFKIEEIRWSEERTKFSAQSMKGDLVVQIYGGRNDSTVVCPHGKLLKKKTLKRRGQAISYLYIEMPSDYRTISWKKFKNVCEGVGLRLPETLYARGIFNVSIARKVQQQVTPEKLLRRN